MGRRASFRPGRHRAAFLGAPGATSRALSSRIATGPIGVSDSIRARIRTDPSLLEDGLRLLDHDVQAGEAGAVDAIAVDRAGSLVIVSITPPDIDRAIARILDLKAWSTDQRDLLGRLYAGHGVAIERPVRFLLLAPALPHVLLRRLALIPIDVTLHLARPVAFEDGMRIAIEPAAAILGLDADPAPHAHARRQSAKPVTATPTVAAAQMSPPADDEPETHARPAVDTEPATSAPGEFDGREAPAAGATPFWPDEVLPPEGYDEKAMPIQPAMELDAGDPIWPASPDDRFPWELPGDPLPDSDEPVPLPEAPEVIFETLTAEEMQEFARFDKQRRERNERSS